MLFFLYEKKLENVLKNEDLKKTIQEHEIPNGFIKVTEKPIGTLNSEQKVNLNRKGNMLFNQGRIEEAVRIFVTTGYSDGLTRVGDWYKDKNEDLLALKYYILAHNKKKSEPIYEKISKLLSCMVD